jgi:hypothetical protein
MAALFVALTPAGAAGDPSSLYRGPGQRPGPDVLYQPPATAPELTNTGVWQAPPILISGTSAYRQGEFLYQDWLYDDHGAHGAHRDQNDAQESPGGNGTSGDLFSTPNGTYTYPTSPAYAGNAADLVEFRVKPVAGATAFRITINSLKDPTLVGISIALGGTPGVAVPFPYGANVRAPAAAFLTIHGTTADLRNAAGLVVDGAVPVTVDMVRRQFEVRLPHSDWDPTGKVERLAAGVGLWDKANNRYLIPQDNADATHPGGAGGLGATAPAFFNVAFRFEHAGGGPNEEPRQSPGDPQGVFANPAWWRDRAQAQALTTGDISAFFVNVDFNKLAAGVSDDMIDQPEGVPTHGAMDRILSSHFETEQGRDYSSACASAQGCKGELRGQLQPYAIYLPSRPPPASGYGLTLLLHSLGANYNQYLGTRNQSEFGDRPAPSIVITPEGRGPDGWYYDYAGADTFEVWADVAARYHLDPSYTDLTGYSMGGYGTYKFATQFPDLFAKAQPTVGPPGLGIWVPPGPPVPGGDSTNTNRQLASVRNIPFLIWNAYTDELVPVAGAVAQANTFDSLGYRYEFDLFTPADHLTLASNDQYQPAAEFLASDKVDYNPAHVSYVYNPTMDFAADGTAGGHAYWISAVTLRDVNQPAAGAPLATVDARSEAFGVGDPPASATQHGAGALTGGNEPALAYTSQSKSWGPTPAAPARDTLDLKTQNVSELTVDAARARLDCNATVNLTVDGSLSLNLVNCPGPGTPRLVGFGSPLGCASRRNFILHVGRSVRGRITEIAVYIRGRRVDHLSGRDLSRARIDLRGLPKGRFAVKVVVHVQQGERTRVVTLHRRYRTCTPRRTRRGKHR